MTTVEEIVYNHRGPKLLDLITEAGRELAENLASGYVRSFEYTLTDRILEADVPPVGDAERDAHIESRIYELTIEDAFDFIFVSCLLDETEESYKACADMNRVLMAAIKAQGRQFDVLRRLVVKAIGREARISPTTEEIN